MVNTLTSSINRKYFAFLLKNNKRYTYLYGFALLIAFPIFVASLSTTTGVETLYYIGKVLSLLIVIAGTVLIPLMMFQFTTSRRSVDVFHSLPIQKEYLFMTNYFAGIVILLVPYLLSTVLGVGVSIAMGMNEISIVMEISNFLLICLGLIVSYSITMFAKKNCGTIIDAFLYTVALNLIPILSYVTYYSFSYQTLLGFNEPFSTNVFYYLTPFPAMFINAVRTTSNFMVDVPAGAYWFYAVVIAALYVASSYLFLNHKSENTNIPFVNRYFYPIVSFISTTIAVILIHTFMNSAFYYDGVSTYIFPLLVGLILYLVLDVIANRGFKHLPKTLMRFGIISGVVLALIVPTRLTNGFGYVERVPDLDNIDSVTVDFGYPMSSYLGFRDYGDSRFTLTDKDEIAVIHNLHQVILDKYKTVGYNKNEFYRSLYETGENSMSSMFTIEYDLGLTKMKRQYTVNTSWMVPVLDLATSDAVIEAKYPMVMHPDQFKMESIWLTDTFETKKDPLYHSIASISWDINDLMAALETDLKNESKEQYYDATHPTIGFLGIQTNTQNRYNYAPTITNVPIKSTYTNTLTFLEDNNLSLPEFDAMQLITSNMIVVYPEVNENRMAFFWNADSQYAPKVDLYNFKYKDVTFLEFKELAPLIHHSFKSDEPNLLLYIQNPDMTLKSYQIRYKDLDIVNTIVQGESHFEATSVYEVMYAKNLAK